MAMTTHPHVTTRRVAFIAMAVAATPVALADVTIQERTSVEGVGLMSVGNMSGTSTTTIAGDRARIESDLQMQSRLVRMFAHGAGGPSASIIRLDQDKVYALDLKKKQYTEESLADQRAHLQAALEQSAKAQPPAGGIDQSQCEWTEPKSDVKRPGEHSSIAGMDAEHVIITASQGCKDKKSGAVCEFGLIFDAWLTPEFAGGDDALKFYQAYAKKMGFDAEFAKEGMRRAESLFSK